MAYAGCDGDTVRPSLFRSRLRRIARSEAIVRASS